MYITNKLILTALVGAIVSIVLVSPVFGITGDEFSTALAAWLQVTLTIALAFVTAMAFSLQIARGYFVRILNKFTLRLGADIWWLAYVLIRDGLIFFSFILGLLVYLPGTFLDFPMAVPFMPLSVVLFGSALLIKLYFDADENRNAFRAVTLLTFFGTVFWVFGTVFILESPLDLSPNLPPGVSDVSGFWFDLRNTFSSSNNLPLAWASFQVCFSALGVMGIIGLAHPLLHSRISKPKKTTSESAPSAPSTGVISTRISQDTEPKTKRAPQHTKKVKDKIAQKV